MLVSSGYCGGSSDGGGSVALVDLCFLDGGSSFSESSFIESGCFWVVRC